MTIEEAKARVAALQHQIQQKKAMNEKARDERVMQLDQQRMKLQQEIDTVNANSKLHVILKDLKLVHTFVGDGKLAPPSKSSEPEQEPWICTGGGPAFLVGPACFNACKSFTANLVVDSTGGRSRKPSNCHRQCTRNRQGRKSPSYDGRTGR